MPIFMWFLNVVSFNVAIWFDKEKIHTQSISLLESADVYTAKASQDLAIVIVYLLVITGFVNWFMTKSFVFQ
jgi:hypothetical protein